MLNPTDVAFVLNVLRDASANADVQLDADVFLMEMTEESFAELLEAVRKHDLERVSAGH